MGWGCWLGSPRLGCGLLPPPLSMHPSPALPWGVEGGDLAAPPHLTSLPSLPFPRAIYMGQSGPCIVPLSLLGSIETHGWVLVPLSPPVVPLCVVSSPASAWGPQDRCSLSRRTWTFCLTGQLRQPCGVSSSRALGGGWLAAAAEWGAAALGPRPAGARECLCRVGSSRSVQVTWTKVGVLDDGGVFYTVLLGCGLHT